MERMVSTMVRCSDRRKACALGAMFILTVLALPAGSIAQEPEPVPAEQIEDPELRGLHAQMLGLQEQMQELRARMAERRRQLLGDDAAQKPPHQGRHATHLRRLGGGRDMGMGMQGMRGRGMMMGRTMSGRGMMRGGMMRRGVSEGSAPRWCPREMGRGMCRGMSAQDAAGQGEPGSEGGGTGG